MAPLLAGTPPAAGLHWAALALAAAATVAGLRRLRGRARATVAVTGGVMTLAMADTAAGTTVLGRWSPLVWAGVLLACGVGAAWAGRLPAPTGSAGPAGAVPASGVERDRSALHLLHVTCLPVMAALTVTMTHHAPGAGGGQHAHGDALATVALAGAAVHVAAGAVLLLGPRRLRAGRLEALTGAGSVAAMAGAALL